MYAIASSVKFIADDNGTTLLDLSSNQILGLNRTGSYIWEAIQRGESLAEIVTELSQATQVQRNTVEADTKEFVELLISKGLLTAEGS